MSQAGLNNVDDGNIPSDVATTYTADSGNSATPAAHILIVSSDDTTSNNNNGIRTLAGATDGLSANEVQVQLTNRIQGSVTTNDATPTALASYSVTIDENDVFTFEYKISAIAIIAGATEGAAFKLWGGVVVDGTAMTATVLGVDSSANFKSAALADVDVDLQISGSTVFILVTGLAGTDIYWDAVGYYTQVTNS